VIPLVVKEVFDPRIPDFPLLRLMADVWFEPARPDTPIAYTYCPAALVDSAAPYVVVPMKSTDRGISRSTRNGGPRPYRILSDQGEPVLQRFAEVGLRFLTGQPSGGLVALAGSIRARQGLPSGRRSKAVKKVLIGLDALFEHFATHLERETRS